MISERNAGIFVVMTSDTKSTYLLKRPFFKKSPNLIIGGCRKFGLKKAFPPPLGH
ncbi:hypothetical protein J7L27_00100 [Candidatus Bathyarchaeota archaeon]|nr:hypothetical protein [Candidatus Bathyarchaeota archaeon]